MEKDIEALQQEKAKLAGTHKEDDLCEHKLELDSLQLKYNEVEIEGRKWKELAQRLEAQEGASQLTEEEFRKRIEGEKKIADELKANLETASRTIEELSKTLQEKEKVFSKQEEELTEKNKIIEELYKKCKDIEQQLMSEKRRVKEMHEGII